ncbi:cytochrome c oxidase assembly factor 6 homolog [Halichondria panicea]|uniref:cytochrome c oxidase assembly factor 6 homolog n=1 Tax=Halichondria panicea TaxID=6063 RepID=UPI00312B397B
MGDKVAPDVKARQVCYTARDNFYQCMLEHHEQEEQCTQFKQTYQNSCLPSWVKYFDKKRVYDEYKKKLQEKGYKPLPDNDR